MLIIIKKSDVDLREERILQNRIVACLSVYTFNKSIFLSKIIHGIFACFQTRSNTAVVRCPIVGRTTHDITAWCRAALARSVSLTGISDAANIIDRLMRVPVRNCRYETAVLMTDRKLGYRLFTDNVPCTIRQLFGRVGVYIIDTGETE